MIDKEKLNQLCEQYKINYDSFIDYDNTIYLKDESRNWEDILEERATQIHRIYNENREITNKVLAELTNIATADEYHFVYEHLVKLYDQEYDDYGSLIYLCKLLLPYYEEHFDAEHLVMLYHIIGFESLNLFLTLDYEHDNSAAYAYFEKIVHMKQYYSSIKTKRVRRCFFTAYQHLLTNCLQKYPEKLAHKAIYYYNDLLKFYNSEAVQKLDNDDCELLFKTLSAKNDIYYLCHFLPSMQQEDREYLIDFVNADYKEIAKTKQLTIHDELYRAYCEIMIIQNKLKISSYSTELYNAIIALPMPDYSNGEKALVLLNNYYVLFDELFVLINNFNYQNYNKARHDEIITKLSKIILAVPYSNKENPVKLFTSSFIRNTISRLKSLEEKSKLITWTLRARQPETYIHSLMVNNITTLIAEGIMEDCPELFIGFNGYQRKEEVLTKQDDILDYLAKAALYHDIGKLAITSVVNQHLRHLSDLEFNLIHHHSELGPIVINHDQDFEPFYDVMMGHHRYYNGSKGQPQTFDNTSSKYRFAIDLITIADCIDAACDFLGRNYANGKSFIALLEELKLQAGTRYNPDIVAYIASNEKLIAKIDEQTKKGRKDLYHRFYLYNLKHAID